MTPMKIPATRLLAAASLLAIPHTATAAVLFTDNYDVNSGSFTTPPDSNGVGPNHDIATPGRQGGTLATPTLGYTFQGNAQVGNTTTLAANSSAGSALGDDVLLAFGASVTINYNFATIGTPLVITFDALPNAQANMTDWFSFLVSENAGTQFVNNNTVDFGMLFRANGGTEIFVDGNNVPGAAPGTFVGQNTWDDYMIILSDAAGTGSAFGTGTSRLDYYQNGAYLGTANVSDPFTAGQGYIGFGGAALAGIDNVQISSIPEPTTIATLGSLAGLALLRRRK